MPEDPFEAEMLLLARASSESVEAEALAQENPSAPVGKILLKLQYCAIVPV